MDAKRWKKVTPIPLEFHGNGYLFECVKCHNVVTYLGRNNYPPFPCSKCESLNADDSCYCKIVNGERAEKYPGELNEEHSDENQ